MSASSGPGPLDPGPIDHALVARLRASVLRELSLERRRRVDGGEPELTREDERRMGRSLLTRALADRRAEQVDLGIAIPSRDEDDAVIQATHAALFGLGRLQSLIDDQSLSEININGCDQVWLIHDDGTKEPGAPVADTDDELVDWVRNVATYTGLSSRAWDLTNWKLEIALPDGSRLVGILGAAARPKISIRLRRRMSVTLDALRVLGDYDTRLQRFLEAVVLAKMNVIVSGETGAGKTILTRAMIAHIPADERILTVEHFPELGVDEDQVAHPDSLALQERLPNAEGQGAISMGELVQASRRMDPDRLIVGEVVGPEVVALLEAMTQGNDGGITTIHARSARGVPQRVATYASQVGMSMESALLLTAEAVDFVVHIERRRTDDGRIQRFVSTVVEVVGYDGTQVVMNEVFATPAGRTTAVPRAAVSEDRGALLAVHGWDPKRDHLDGTGGVW